MEGARLYYDRYLVFDVSFGHPHFGVTRMTPEEQRKTFGEAIGEIEDLLRQINQVAVNKLLAEPHSPTMNSFRDASRLFLQDLRPRN
jgi:hypothetical protein